MISGSHAKNANSTAKPSSSGKASSSSSGYCSGPSAHASASLGDHSVVPTQVVNGLAVDLASMNLIGSQQLFSYSLILFLFFLFQLSWTL